MKRLLIVGCYRSGTTLAEKIANMHPQMAVASQPFPVLYFLVKQAFNERHHVNTVYPLDHRFRQGGYTQAQLQTFLDGFVLDDAMLDALFEKLGAYREGLWTPEMAHMRGRVLAGTFFDVFVQLMDCVGTLFGGQACRIIGAKEVLVEEYAPFLATRGVKLVFVVRDPRAMITSLNYRTRDNLTGEHRPLLYSLRVWRKSVAYAFQCTAAGQALTLRYEDLVIHRDESLKRLTTFLDIDPFGKDFLRNGITDQWGQPWRGNSSFADHSRVSAASLTSYETLLPDDVRDFIDVTCGPEMKALGYAVPHFSSSAAESTLCTFNDAMANHAAFEPGYSSDPRRIADELTRLSLVGEHKERPAGGQDDDCFITATAARVLRSRDIRFDASLQA